MKRITSKKATASELLAAVSQLTGIDKGLIVVSRTGDDFTIDLPDTATAEHVAIVRNITGRVNA